MARERRQSMKTLYLVVIIMFLLLALGTVSLAIGLRQQGIENREADEQEAKERDEAICEGQNDLRKQIRDYVVDLTESAEAEAEIKRRFADLPCMSITGE